MKGASDVGNEVAHAATMVAGIGPGPVHRVVRSGFTFCLAFVLEPYCDGFYLHSTCRGNGLAVLTGRMGILVKEVLEHCELGVCEPLSCTPRAADDGDGAGTH